MKIPAPELVIGSLFITGFALGFGLGFGNNSVCVDPGVVDKIVSINYRDATIKLVDGRSVQVNQSTLKPGDTVCMKYSH